MRHSRAGLARGPGRLAELDRLCRSRALESWWRAAAAPGGLIARERPDDGGDRAFDHVLTYDRPVVVELARLLMVGVAPLRAAGRG